MNKKFFSFILMTAIFAAVLSSCKKDDPPTFSVTFDSKGGTPTPATQIVEKGGKVEKPDDPTLTNHQFAGWTTADDATSSLWDFENGTVTADMTLFAKWEQNTYSITVSVDENGTASASATSAVECELITLTATANSGYCFVEWQVIEGGITLSGTTDNPATFIMPNEAVEVKAIFGWEQDRYSITVVSNENGTASASVTSAVIDEIITLTATANSGYRFVEWQVIKGDIYLYKTTSNPAIFYMPNEEVEVKAIFVPLVGLLHTFIVSQENSQTWYEYYYDSQNRFTECTGVSHIKTLNYNAAGDLVKYFEGTNIYLPRGSGSETTFSKYDNKITFTTWYRILFGGGDVKGELELNAQGLPVKMTSETVQHYYGSDANWSHTVTLTWQNGNLTKAEWEREDENGSSAGTVTYIYDDKKTPFYHCNTPKWFWWWFNFSRWNGYNEYGDKNYGYNENNIKTETWEEDGSTITYEYTYNDDGFPVTRTWEQGWEWVWGYGTTTFSETYTYK